MLADFVTFETRAGEPRSIGDSTIVPMARVLRVQIPGMPVGLIWNCPAAVMVHTAAGEERVLPVVDPTRQTLLLLMGAMIGMVLFAGLLRRRK
jgi:hypothetical protein